MVKYIREEIMIYVREDIPSKILKKNHISCVIYIWG